jgi:DNA-binding transcriptional MerR regulator
VKKIYYTIGEVSELLGEKQSTLRYWEKEFKLLTPRRSSGGRRLYTEQDINLLKKIQYFLHEAKYSIEGARRCFNEKSTESNILERLENIKRILEE